MNGEDYGWTREGGNVGKYRIVMVEMGKVKLELFGRIVELKLLPEDAIKKISSLAEIFYPNIPDFAEQVANYYLKK